MCTLAALPAWAQETRGNINGTIKDAQGVIPGANVRITNIENGQTQTAHHQRNGLLRSAAAAGRAISRHGRNAELQDAESGRRAQRRPDARVSLTLEVGNISETVNVTAEAPILDTTSVSSGQNFDRALIEGLPMAANQPMLLVEIRAGHRRPDHAATRPAGPDRRSERRRRRPARRRRQLQLHDRRRDQRRQQPPHGGLAELRHDSGDARRDVELRRVPGPRHRRQHLADDARGHER